MKSPPPDKLRAPAPAPAYGGGDPEPAGFQVVVADRGRIVLPAEVRERLEIRDGDRLSLVVGRDGTIQIRTRAVVIRSLSGLFKDLSPARSAVDELIAERRREAAMEERDTRELLARARRKKR